MERGYVHGSGLARLSCLRAWRVVAGIAERLEFPLAFLNRTTQLLTKRVGNGNSVGTGVATV